MLSHGYIAGFQLVIKGTFFFLKNGIITSLNWYGLISLGKVMVPEILYEIYNFLSAQHQKLLDC